METYEQQTGRKVALGLVLVAVVAGVVFYADHVKAPSTTNTAATTQTGSSTSGDTSSGSAGVSTSGDATTDSSSTSSDGTSTSSSSSAGSSSSSSTGIKDGSYSATEDYFVPHGDESIAVTLTVKDGIITDSSIENSEGDHDSARYQEEFASVYKQYVVGKKLSGLQLGIISGASDTTEGFNAALKQIASQAQA